MSNIEESRALSHVLMAGDWGYVKNAEEFGELRASHPDRCRHTLGAYDSQRMGLSSHRVGYESHITAFFSGTITRVFREWRGERRQIALTAFTTDSVAIRRRQVYAHDRERKQREWRLLVRRGRARCCNVMTQGGGIPRVCVEKLSGLTYGSHGQYVRYKIAVPFCRFCC